MSETPGQEFEDETSPEELSQDEAAPSEQTWGNERQGPDADLELTGHPRIDEALERLGRLDGADVSTHPEEFDAIHGVLRESLANAGRAEDVTESP